MGLLHAAAGQMSRGGCGKLGVKRGPVASGGNERSVLVDLAKRRARTASQMGGHEAQLGQKSLFIPVDRARTYRGPLHVGIRR